MKRDLLRLFTMLPFWVLATLCATAQQPDAVAPSATTDQPDTLTVIPLQVQQYRVMMPFISDSLNVQGKAYDATDLLKP
ncbi:hypothetical protein, partial [Porphyromonas sp.]